jgi:hypothetical protein
VISARALGVYLYLRTTDSSISAERLSEVFSEGREAMRAALRELKSYNMISSTFEHINGRVMTVNRLLGPEYWGPETRRLIPLYMQNSNLILDAYSFKHSEKLTGCASEEEKMSDWYEGGPSYLGPEEVAEFRRKKRAADRQVKEAQRAATFDKEMEARRKRQPVDWTVPDAVYHFCERMVRFDIRPWQGYREKFQGAYAKARSIHDTTGDIEEKMMDRFFVQVDNMPGVKEPDHIWKLFIKQFGALANEVKTYEVTEVKMDESKAEAERQLEKF